MPTDDSIPRKLRTAHSRRLGQRGFTLIELILVMVILGVLAVYAGPRIFSTSTFDPRGFHDETLAILRYAQKTAIAQRRTTCVAMTGTSVTLTMFNNNPAVGGCPAPFPLSLPNAPLGGTGLTSSVPAFQFTPLGDTDKTTTVVINIVGSTPITVETGTGYVHD